MVYVEEWDAFLQQAQAMVTAAPATTRLLIKYRHVEGTFTVKVTDNIRVRGNVIRDGSRV
jgi:signal recognition particle subunit SRP9